MSTGLVLFDMKCAFDSVWHDGLIFKMVQLGVPRHLTKIVRSFLNNRSFQVKVGNKTSTSRTIPAGVPQGAVLSPLLFNILVHDLPLPTLGTVGQFADDIAAWFTAKRAAPIRKELQDYASGLSKYLSKWKLKMNPAKTEAVFFTRRRCAGAFPKHPIKLEGYETVWNSAAKYLGVYLDKTLTFGRHTEYILEKGNVRVPCTHFSTDHRNYTRTTNYCCLKP